jgi:3D (Asp-Asp-Asp) domain-containing protein
VKPLVHRFLFSVVILSLFSFAGWEKSNAASLKSPNTGVRIQINDELVSFPDAKPFIDHKSRVQVPLRFVTEKLGYKVKWAKEGRQVKITLTHPGQGSTIVLRTNYNKVVMNSGTMTMSTAPVLLQDRVYVPLRYMIKIINIPIDWDADTRVAMVREDGIKYAPAADSVKTVKVIHAVATAYSKAPEENGGWGPVDYFGNPLVLGTVAVDPSVIPLGTQMYITGYDAFGLPRGGFMATATDIGGAIKDNRIDIFVPGPKKNALQFGIQKVKIHILD